MFHVHDTDNYFLGEKLLNDYLSIFFLFPLRMFFFCSGMDFRTPSGPFRIPTYNNPWNIFFRT